MEVIREHQIEVENMYNMDETGFSIGNIKGAYVVVNKTLQTKLKAHPGRQEWVTVLECVSADGDAIPPYIILKGMNMTNAWIPSSVMSLNWHIGCNSKGWTDNYHCQVNRKHVIRHNLVHIHYHLATFINVVNATVNCGFVMEFMQNVHKIYTEYTQNVQI